MAFADYDFQLTANGSQQLPVSGSVVRVRSSSGTLRVSIDGGPGVKLGAGQGFRLGPGQSFRDVTIRDVSGAANTGVIFIGDAGYEDQTFTGDVNVIGLKKNFIQVDKKVVAPFGASADGIGAALTSGNRSYLAVQNLSDTGNVYLVFAPAGFSYAKTRCLKLGPGEFIEWDRIVPQGVMSAHKDVGSADVDTVVIEA